MAKRLTALDIAFLGLETQRTPVNVASLQILEIPAGYKGNFIRDLLGKLADLEPGPPFNLRLNRGNLMNMPHWQEDEHFDLSYHVRHSALPEPGDMNELLSLVSRLHSRVMDRERPLWEFHVIEGLQNNQFAIYMKMHHAAIDGMGGIALLEACYGESPDSPLRAPWQSGRERRQGYARHAFADTLTDMSRAVGSQLRMLPDLGKLLAGNGMKAMGLKPAEAPVPFTAPKSLFNGHISGARRFAVTTISLGRIKKLAKAAGATVNDIVLATCSGALRHYLEGKDALPEDTLVASVPVSIRQLNRSGNQITYVGAKLATDERRPLKRLEQIHQSTAQAKEEMAEVAPAAAMTFAVMAQGLVAVLNRFQMSGILPPPANVIISNVPGPRKALYLGGAKMLANYPLSVLVDGQALNITVVSYMDAVDFGLMACREVVPDVEHLATLIDDAFNELESAIEKDASRKERAAARKKKVRSKKKAATARKKAEPADAEPVDAEAPAQGEAQTSQA
ncbi:MAG: wax ester/triacylglycerol synthase family O-acyltransferase [Pseudomonadota bacterium]